MNILVLDAMGVICSAGDDVGELLHPFLLEKGGINDSSRIDIIYDAASLGAMRSSELWEANAAWSGQEFSVNVEKAGLKYPRGAR